MCCYTVLCLELVLNWDRRSVNKMMIIVIFILVPGTFTEWLWLLCAFNLRGPLHSLPTARQPCDPGLWPVCTFNPTDPVRSKQHQEDAWYIPSLWPLYISNLPEPLHSQQHRDAAGSQDPRPIGRAIPDWRLDHQTPPVPVQWTSSSAHSFPGGSIHVCLTSASESIPVLVCLLQPLSDCQC